MEAIILAGGFGTRLKGVISNIPKPMAPVNNGRPFLSYVFDNLIINGVDRLVLSVGYKYEIIKKFYGDSYKSCEIIYSVESKPLGTGGAIKKALKYVNGHYFFIVNGDTFFKTDLKKGIEKIFCKKFDIIIFLRTMKDFDRYGSVELDSENKIIAFQEKKYIELGLINSGIYISSKSILEKLPKINTFSFEKDFLEKRVSELNFKAIIKEGYFIDIGIPEDYLSFVKKNEK